MYRHNKSSRLLIARLLLVMMVFSLHIATGFLQVTPVGAQAGRVRGKISAQEALRIAGRQDRVSGQLVEYDTLPGALRSPFTILVNGQSLFVEQYKDVHYVRFAFTGTVSIIILAPTLFSSYRISPLAYGITPTQFSNALFFTLDQPRKLIVQLGSQKVFILPDAPDLHAPGPGDANVVNVTSYLSDTTGNVTQTAQIQHAIDSAAGLGNRIVYFPPGRYVSGTLFMRSNVSLYLSSGALLQGTGNAADYSEQHFIVFKRVSNSRLYGRGAIDARGLLMRTLSGDSGRVKIVRTISSAGITIQDLLLRDAGSWSVHIAGSNAISVSNLKIINDLTNTNNDGIDPDGSSNVLIDNNFLYTTDDCFAVKASGTFNLNLPTSNVWIRNGVCYTRKSGLKVGTETRMPITHINFESNHIVHADRAIALYMADGSLISNVRYLNNSSEEIGGDSKQRLIDITISSPGDIHNVEITNYVAYSFSPHASTITGRSDHIIDITFHNLFIAGQLRTNAASAQIEYVYANLSFA